MKTRTLAALALGLLLAAAPARAIDDVTGTYEGTASCKGVFGGEATKVKSGLTLQLLETKDGLAMATTFESAPESDVYGAFVTEQAAKADRAKLGAVDCSLEAIGRTGLAVQGDVVIKPGSAKGTVKGSLILFLDPIGIDACTFSVKRVSTEPPMISTCN